MLMEDAVTGLGEVGGGALLIAVMGGGSVGKSAITLRFISGQFVEEYDPTIEDCHRKTINVHGQPQMFDIIDTAGQEEYLYISEIYTKIGNGFIFVFDVSNKQSIKDVERFYEAVETCRNIEDVPKILIGNKNDLPDRQVAVSEGEKLAEKFQCQYFDASAKNCVNIQDAFQKIATLVVEKEKEKKPTTPIKAKRFCTLL